MKCSFKEATLRFKPGNRFIVNEGVAFGNSIANPGDIIVLRFIYISGDSWGIRFDFDGVPPNPAIAGDKFILSKYIEPVASPPFIDGDFSL